MLRRLIFLWMLLPLSGYGQHIAQPKSQQNVAADHSYFWGHIPQPGGWVNDYEGIFSEEERAGLTARLTRIMPQSNAQFCIVTIDTTAVAPEKFDSLIRYIANVWGVGQKGLNNGITIGICKGYRRIRICNGRGVEARLTDAATQEIIDGQMIPCFRKGAYYDGMLAGLDALAARLSAKK